MSSATPGGFDRGDVDLFHRHHRVERSFSGGWIGIGDRFAQGDRGDLPGKAPFVLAPAANLHCRDLMMHGIPFRRLEACALDHFDDLPLF